MYLRSGFKRILNVKYFTNKISNPNQNDKSDHQFWNLLIPGSVVMHNKNK